MSHISVKAAKLGSDPDLLSQVTRKHASLRGELEAREAAARVDAAAGHVSAGHEHAVAGDETQQLALRRAPAAAGTAPNRLRRCYSSSGSSTGIPAGTSAGSATSTAAATGGSSGWLSVGSAIGVESGTSSSTAAASSASSESAGGPAT